jgi:hypothetical protein
MQLRVFSRRWGHDDVYEISRTENGWQFAGLSIHGECDKSGHPFLFKALDHDSINYPADLRGYMEYLWNESADQNEEWIQERLNELSEWIRTVEKSSPASEFWKTYS